MRKLATIRKIDSVSPIEGADAIECAVVGGWTVVVKRGEYRPGDLAVYCEIDSWIPHELAPFLSKGSEPRIYNGVKGERLRSIRLRDQLSQGLLLPRHTVLDKVGEIREGDDVTELLGIQKWEAPIPAQLAGEVKGAFPGFIPKTDQERVQNLTAELEIWKEKNYTWEATEKLDGSSMTVYVHGGEAGVCSRNLELRQNESNSLWRVAVREQLIEKLQSTGLNLALQGEIIGEGIQKNPYGIRGQDFYLYDVYDIDAARYYNAHLRQRLAQELNIKHVPVLDTAVKFDAATTVAGLLSQAEAKSLLNAKTEREGIVFKCIECEASFKSISNKFLLKNGD